MTKSSFLHTFLPQNPVWTGTLHAVAKTCNKSKFGLEHGMQLHTLATNPSLDWNTACSCTHLQQNQVWIEMLHAVTQTFNKSKFGLEHCMQSHRLSTNPSLDGDIFNHADLCYRTAKTGKGRKEGCLQPGERWTLPLSLSFLLPFAARRLPVSAPQLPASSPLPAAPAHRSSVGPVGEKECKMCVKTKKIYPQWHDSPIMSPPVTA